jgi:hypothetical protein
MTTGQELFDRCEENWGDPEEMRAAARGLRGRGENKLAFAFEWAAAKGVYPYRECLGRLERKSFGWWDDGLGTQHDLPAVLLQGMRGWTTFRTFEEAMVALADALAELRSMVGLDPL